MQVHTTSCASPGFRALRHVDPAGIGAEGFSSNSLPGWVARKLLIQPVVCCSAETPESEEITVRKIVCAGSCLSIVKGAFFSKIPWGAAEPGASISGSNCMSAVHGHGTITYSPG